MSSRASRSFNSKVVCFFKHEGEQCNDEYICFREIYSRPYDKKWFPKATSLLSVLFLKADLFYPSNVDIFTSYVCSSHLTNLSKPHRLSTSIKCISCESFGKISKKTVGYTNVNNTQALVLFERLGIRKSYGELICTSCRVNDVPDLVDKNHEKNHLDAFEWLNRLPSTDASSECDNESDEFRPSPQKFFYDEEEKKMVCENRRKLLNMLLEECGSNRKAWLTFNYKRMEGQVKSNFLSSVRSIWKIVVSVLAPDEVDDVYEDAMEISRDKEKCVMDGSFFKVMSGIKEAYENADSATSRKEILSIVAPKVTYKMVQEFITGLTHYRFTEARFYAADIGVGVSIDLPSRISQRFSLDQVEHFIDFIVSPHICTDMPFGENRLKLSDGTILYVPNTIRNVAPSRIIAQYNAFCEENVPSFVPLQAGSLLKILGVCKASYRKCLQGLNYFAADGGEAFDRLSEMVKNMKLNDDLIKSLCDNLKRGRSYLKSDYKTHILKSSSTADHCATYALSDTSNISCRELCDHSHDAYCIECETLTQTLSNIETCIKENSGDTEMVERSLAIFQHYKDSINSWKFHLLRSVNQDMAREYLLSSLADDTIFIYLDWAMKWLPAKYREPQSFFFGKRGISWHIAVVVKKSRSNINTISRESDSETQYSSDEENSRSTKHTFSQKVFVHVLDSCSQDSSAVLCIVENILTEIHLSDPIITKALLRSDNAGCYHSAETLLSLPYMSERTGIEVKRVDFSDPQGGKSPCDRLAAVLKSRVRRYLNEKNDVTNASEFVAACRSYGGTPGVKVSECRLATETNTAVKFKFAGVTSYNNFKFEKDGILAHRAWTIGAGKFFPFSNLKFGQKWKKLDCEEQLNFKHEWTEKTVSSEDKKSIKIPKTEGNQIELKCKSSFLFECSEEGCIKKFLKYSNLIHHIVSGKHIRKPERYLLKDTAMQLYHSKLECIQNQEMISLLLETSHIENTLRTSENYKSILIEGWAFLRVRKNIRFNEKQTKFLLEKFEEGIRTSVRWKPETVAQQIQELKVHGKFYFKASEFLTAAQIRSYFSRQKSKRQGIKTNEVSVENEDEEFFEDYLLLEEASEKELLLHNCEKLLDEDDNEENPIQLNRGTKHHTSNNHLSDAKRSSFRVQKN